MKLNYKRTICVGFAFFLICAFWQAYDNIIPLILTNKFGLSQADSGIIMAFDNILALFMLPLFGALSDKTNSKLGKRTPYVLIGTIIAVIAFVALTFADSAQLAKLGSVSQIDSEQSLSVLYDHEYKTPLMTPEGGSFELVEKFTKKEF
ncbi:MAG: MFS transporter, partial [Clostridia bacterium]|nr:MFS transporter [Clostridia bacterium]